MAGVREHRKRALIEAFPEGVTTAAALARQIGVSDRTVYRYVKALRKQGYKIAGETGYGLQLRARPAQPIGERADV